MNYPVILANAAASWSHPATAMAAAPAPGAGELVLRMFGALLLVIALLYGAVWLLKRWRFFPGVANGQSQLKLVENKAIGARQSVVVIGYGEKRFLVASTPQGVSLLTNLPDAPPEPVTEAAPVPQSAPAKFGELLLAAIQQRSCR